MTEHNGDDSIEVGHETTDAEIGPLVKFAVFLAVLCLAIAALMVGFHRYLEAREAALKQSQYPMTIGMERPLPPPPRLQSYPFDDLRALRREEQRLLDRYEWVDRNAGLVRIPVSRAIELLAERGLPQRPPADEAAPETPETPETPEAPAPGTGTAPPAGAPR